MHSRLYRNVLGQYSWAHNVTAFNSLHNNTGLFGIMSSAESSQASKAIDVICKEFEVNPFTQEVFELGSLQCVMCHAVLPRK